MTVEVVITQDTATAALADVRARLQEPAPVLVGPVTDAVREAYRQQFETAGAHFGEAWEALSPETFQRHGDSFGTLVETGALRASLTERDALGSLGEMIDPWTLAVGTEGPVAELQQQGTRRMPARPLVGEVPPEDVDAWADLIAGYLVTGEL